MKNAASRRVRNRTSGSGSPESRDRRVRRTRKSLHDALIGLAREKPYDTIAVKEILARADVGRSTFYMHFGDKDELLDSGIHELVRAGTPQATGEAIEQLVAFSLPLLERIDQHRHASGPKMGRSSRLVIHGHLKEILAERIAGEMKAAWAPDVLARPIPTDLVARHIASTFVLVLNWWVEREPDWTPGEVNARFRALVLPGLSRI